MVEGVRPPRGGTTAPLRVALVGVGGYGRTHLAAIEGLSARGLCALEAVVIRNPGKCADVAGRLPGVRVHRSLEALIAAEAGRVDLVILATGIPDHAAQTEAALQGGFHVLCEKPAAGSWTDGLRMKLAAERSGRLLAVGFQNLASASVRGIQRLALSGRLGRLVAARGLVLSPRSATYYARNRWAGRLSVDGVSVMDSPVQNAAGHYLANLLFAAGPREGETAMPSTVAGESYRAAAIQGADTQCLRVTTAQGCRIDFAASHAVPEAREIAAEYELEGGRILWRKGGDTKVFDAGGRLLERLGNAPQALEELLLEDVIAAIRDGRPPLCPIENALAHTACVELLFLSAPVRTIDRRHVIEVPGSDGSPVAAVEGITALMETMYRERLSFAEAGAPWATRGRLADAAELSRARQ